MKQMTKKPEWKNIKPSHERLWITIQVTALKNHYITKRIKERVKYEIATPNFVGLAMTWFNEYYAITKLEEF